jgi:hypothetical protein
LQSMLSLTLIVCLLPVSAAARETIPGPIDAQVPLTESSRVTFESSDTAVATVDKSGTITAVGAGHTAVVSSYGPRDKGIKASIPVEVR